MKRFLCGLAALGLLVGKAGQTRADYIFTPLNGYEANGINDSGQIVGANRQGGSSTVTGSTLRSTFPIPVFPLRFPKGSTAPARS
jgi:hypothetical protein